MTFWKPLFLSGISEITKVCRVVLYWIIYYLHHFSALLRYNWQVKIYIWIIQLDVLVYKHCEIIPTIKLISMSITSNSYYFLWWEYLRSMGTFKCRLWGKLYDVIGIILVYETHAWGYSEIIFTPINEAGTIFIISIETRGGHIYFIHVHTVRSGEQRLSLDSPNPEFQFQSLKHPASS